MDNQKLKQFIKFAAHQLGLEKIPDVHFVGHEEDKHNAFGHFQHSDDAIKVRTIDRHPLDVMRTVAHEMAHYKWRLEGKVGDNVAGGESENYAHARAGEIMRKYDNSHPSEFKDKPLKEDGAVAVNAMGTSSSTAGTGGIDTFDPLLQKPKKKLRDVLSRKLPVGLNGSRK
jgi:hypothetical protein